MKKNNSNNEKIYKTIAEEIRRMIENGTLQPGDKLPSLKELAQRFGVSRATIRESFSSLQGMGLIELRHGTGTFVSETNVDKRLYAPMQAALLIGRNDLLKLHEVRTILEVGACRSAAENRTPESYEEIAAALMEFEWAVTDVDLVHADLRFHQAIAAASGNPVLENLLTTLTEAMSDILRTTLPRLSFPEVAQDYRELADAIREGRPEQASRVATRYLNKLMKVLEQPIPGSTNIFES